MKKIELLIFTTIIIVAFVLRLYKIDRPLADWHSWRQADTAAVARNFIKEGFNPFIPRYDDMSSQANGLDNPQRYRFVEFPVYNSIIAAVWLIGGINVTSARFVTVFITLGSTIFLYFLVRYFSGWRIAALAAFFFATLPYNVFYSSTILPGPLMVFGILGMFWAFSKWLEKERWLWMLLSIFFANVAILSWPIAIFFLLPLAYLVFNKYGWLALKRTSLWIFAVSILMPFLLWRLWMTQFPQGIPNWQFLLNESGIRFRGAFFRWIFAERIGKLILTLGGSFLLILGILTKPVKKENLFYLWWLAAVGLYFMVFASGNVRHDYYQIPFVPIACVFMAKGMRLLFKLPAQYFNRWIGPVVAIVLVLFTFAFGYFEIQGYYWINKPQIVVAGKAVDRLLPKDATVIADYKGDAAFLYQTNRHGYPIVDRPLEKFIDQGTKYFASVDVNNSGVQNLARYCKVIDETSDYVIVEMFKECVGR